MLVRRIPPGYAEAKQLRLAWAEDVTTLFKFRGYAGPSRRWVNDIIKNSRIFVPHPTQFNDPFDVRPIFRHSGDPNDPKYVAALLKRQRQVATQQGKSKAEIANLERLFGETVHDLPRLVELETHGALRERNRVLCLSADPLHPLQWSHYADSHRGVCLHFWSWANSIFGQARRVRYTSRRVPIRLRPKPIPLLSTAERLAFTKADFWSYEREYRICRPDGLPDVDPLKRGFLHFHPRLLTGVTVGSQMPGKERRALIRFIARYRPNLIIWEAYEVANEFKLDMRQLGVASKVRI